MTNEQAKQVFNDIIAKTQDADEIAKLELMREYFCNPPFRQALEDQLWAKFNRYTRETPEPRGCPVPGACACPIR